MSLLGRRMEPVGFACRMALAIVLLVAAASKGSSPRVFAQTIRQIGLQAVHARAAAWVVITVEALLGTMLALRIWPLVASISAMGLVPPSAAEWAPGAISGGKSGSSKARPGASTRL